MNHGERPIKRSITFREPWPHWIVKGLCSRYELAELHKEWEANRNAGFLKSEGWVWYDNDCEFRKRTNCHPHWVGAMTAEVFGDLYSRVIIDYLQGVTGIGDLHEDPTMHGAGVHAVLNGGYLNAHLDYARHPTADPPMERRLNLILFVCPDGWKPEWGGAFELCDESGTVRKRIFPQHGTAVVWEPTDEAMHGTQMVSVGCQSTRWAAAVYYLSPARERATRRRALFCPKRG